MKKIIFALTLMLTAITAKAMTYEQARDQALFLTDKMAYELDLTEEQYEAAFEVNLDYLMSINTVDDVYSSYWTRRNLDLSYILYDWQYRTFCGLEYFYRPLYWGDGFWHFRIYAYYPHRHYHYYGYPACYYSYRGAHSWHANGGRSWYNGRHFARAEYGMRGGWDRGGYRNIGKGWRYNDGGHRGYDRRDNPHVRNPHNGTGYRRDGNRHDFNNRGQYNGNRYNGNRNDREMNEGRRHYGNGSNSHVSPTPRSSTRETVGGHRSTDNSSYTPSHNFSGRGNGSVTNRPTGSSHFSGGHNTTSRSSFGHTRGGGMSGSHGSRSSNSGGGHFGGGHR